MSALHQRTNPGYDAFVMLRLTFAVAPILFGLDKFFNVLTDWPMYLAGWATTTSRCVTSGSCSAR